MFFLVGISHLIGLLFNSKIVTTITKPLIVPSLYLSYDGPWTNDPSFHCIFLFSWIGDLLLMHPKTIHWGILSFSVSHISHIILLSNKITFEPIYLCFIIPLATFFSLTIAKPMSNPILKTASNYYILVLTSIMYSTLVVNDGLQIIGCILFIFSDCLIGIRMIKKHIPYLNIYNMIIMITYMAALFLFFIYHAPKTSESSS